jgi:glycosyltransferase involved in cell wall biosynthesis
MVPPAWTQWPHYPMTEPERGDDWGASYVAALYRDRWGTTPGVIWLVWDPSRVAAYVQSPEIQALSVRIWTYSAIDAPNRNATVGGPAAYALQQADRVIAYGRWGSTIIKPVRTAPVPYLPHGLDPAAYAQPLDDDDRAWQRAQLGRYYLPGMRVVGCVATNQPRKDLGLYFQTLAELKARGHAIYGWLHTDVLVKAWAIAQLVEDCGLQRQITVTTREWADADLARLYRLCDVTVAPGLGEGFGYPIVESLASGVPVVHGDFGGGRELIPKQEWRFPVREIRLDGIYAQQRPVFRPEDVANAIERVWDLEATIGQATLAAYCRGSIAHLSWASLAPRWLQWVRQGVQV